MATILQVRARTFMKSMQGAGRGAPEKYALDGHKGNLHVGVTGRTVLCDY